MALSPFFPAEVRARMQLLRCVVSNLTHLTTPGAGSRTSRRLLQALSDAGTGAAAAAVIRRAAFVPATELRPRGVGGPLSGPPFPQSSQERTMYRTRHAVISQACKRYATALRGTPHRPARHTKHATRNRQGQVALPSNLFRFRPSSDLVKKLWNHPEVGAASLVVTL